ncbi:tetratricopeptide repeat protein [Candidatus Parabeggiatoa sp. HSG14]|uniref:tetratricopeptide repeat protein n=1 Tax=Candidatus Parabeggiatoa sp. HSG14 TaxID=3055593 RepID=UPI0025A7B4A9|nr:tetratricopeptide repeat protein [Thiotrichales bacterium HSG14]
MSQYYTPLLCAGLPINESRDILIKRQDIQKAAEEWQDKKSKQAEYLLQGPKLNIAEDYLKSYADTMPLPDLAQKFVKISIKTRRRNRFYKTSFWVLVFLALGFGFIDANIQREEAEIQRELSALRYQGTMYMMRDKPQDALDIYQKALDFSKEIKNQFEESNSLSNMGMVYTNHLNEHELALDYFEQALKIRNEINDFFGKQIELLNLAMVSARLGKKQQAEDYKKRAEEISINVETKQRNDYEVSGYIDNHTCNASDFQLLRNDNQPILVKNDNKLYAGDVIMVEKNGCLMTLRLGYRFITLDKTISSFVVPAKEKYDITIAYEKRGIADAVSRWFGSPWGNKQRTHRISAAK